eukprot:c7568_g1_i3.p1 GENE.c7568_g1_i3~~c7568_g1_i3.p1  ORF type:complete len:241 (+),score=53.17 c7568_g1_i3:34-756(+)
MFFRSAQPAPQRIDARAGRCSFQGGLVTPIAEKGLISIYTDESGLTHFEWKSRVSGAVVDDFIIMQSDVKWLRVPQCTTGRVFLLDYGTDDSRHFYWMQEPNPEKDEILFAAVQAVVDPQAASELLSTPQARSRVRPPASAAVTPAAAAAPTAPPPLAHPSRAGASQPPISQVLQDALAAIGAAQQPDISLTEVLKPETTIPLLRTLLQEPEVRERLFPFLPESQVTIRASLHLFRSKIR